MLRERSLGLLEQKREHSLLSESIAWQSTVTQDQRSTWLQKLDAECHYQIVLPRRQLMDDSAIMDFLLSYVGKFDLYVEDQCPAYVRYCFEEPMGAAIFRSRFEPRSEPFRLAG